MPPFVSLSIVRGDDYVDARRLRFRLTGPITDANDVEPGEPGYITTIGPIDLTGTDGIFMVKRRFGQADEDALITKTNGDGIEYADPQTDDGKGLAFIEIPAEDTEDGPWGSFFHAYRCTDSLGVTTVVEGRFNIKRELITGD